MLGRESHQGRDTRGHEDYARQLIHRSFGTAREDASDAAGNELGIWRPAEDEIGMRIDKTSGNDRNQELTTQEQATNVHTTTLS